MVKEKLVINKLNELEKYLKQLREYEGVDKEKFEYDLNKLWSVERGLQLCIQIILDIGNHILSEEGITVENYSDIFKELIKLDVIPMEFGKRIRGMAGFRNILVHEYADVDLEIIVKTLNNSLDDFGKYASFIEEYLKE